MTPQGMLMAQRPVSMLLLLLSSAGLVGFMLASHACSSRAIAVYEVKDTSAELLSERESGLRVGTLLEEGQIGPGSFWASTGRVDAFLRFTSGSKDPEPVTRTLTPGPDGTLIVEIASEAKSAATGRNVLAKNNEGDITIVSNAANGIESEFEPKALFMPSTLSAGQEIVREIKVNATGPMFGSGNGDGTSTIRGIGTQTIEVPAGMFDAFVLESELSFTVGPALIVLGQRAWVAQDAGTVGIVAEEGRELVKVFGISVHSQTRVSVLSEQSSESN
ncbi:MAG: hypothetical protein Phyf2KO_10920 [Phycisphaerales bacterium]